MALRMPALPVRYSSFGIAFGKYEMRARVSEETTVGTAASGGFVTDLRRAGYAVLPAPRRVELAGEEVRIDASWGLVLSQVDEGDIAARTLRT